MPHCLGYIIIRLPLLAKSPNAYIHPTYPLIMSSVRKMMGCLAYSYFRADVELASENIEIKRARNSVTQLACLGLYA